MFTRWFKKGDKGAQGQGGEKGQVGGGKQGNGGGKDMMLEGPLKNQNQVSAHLSQQQSTKTATTATTTPAADRNAAGDVITPKSGASGITTTKATPSATGLGEGKKKLTQTSTRHRSNSNTNPHPTTTNHHNSSTTMTVVSQPTYISEQELGQMPVEMANKVRQLTQWHHDISLLQQRLVTYSNMLIDIARAGIDVSAAGRTIENNADLYNHTSKLTPSIKITPEHIAAFEAFHWSIELATKQVLGPILATNDPLLKLPVDDVYNHRAAEHVTRWHQNLIHQYQQFNQHQNYGQGGAGSGLPSQLHSNQRGNPITPRKTTRQILRVDIPHTPELGDENDIAETRSISMTHQSFTNTARLSVAPTRRTYRESRITTVPQGRRGMGDGQGYGNHLAGHGNGVNSFASLIVQPPRAQLPSSRDAQQLHLAMDSWKDGMFNQVYIKSGVNESFFF